MVDTSFCLERRKPGRFFTLTSNLNAASWFPRCQFDIFEHKALSIMLWQSWSLGLWLFLTFLSFSCQDPPDLRGKGRDRNFIYFLVGRFRNSLFNFRSFPSFFLQAFYLGLRLTLAFLLVILETSIPSSSIVISTGSFFGSEFKSHTRVLSAPRFLVQFFSLTVVTLFSLLFCISLLWP